jgi:hypothetical protein
MYLYIYILFIVAVIGYLYATLKTVQRRLANALAYYNIKDVQTDFRLQKDRMPARLVQTGAKYLITN